MFALLYNKTPHSLSSVLRNFCDLRFLGCTPIIITRSLSSKITSQSQVKESSFTVSYLINECGLSPEDANVASKRVQFETQDRPNSVLSLFYSHGFSNSQITRIIKLCPRLLLANPKKTILNKLEFYSSIGIVGPDLTKFISLYPKVLQKSLSNRSIPIYKFLKDTLEFDDYTIIRAMSNASKYFLHDVERINANFLALREVGMPLSVIHGLVIHHINLLCYKVDIFRDKVDEIINMGFLPSDTKFIHALSAKIGFSESNWQHRIKVYRRCGWSEEEILLAFRKYPICMTFSEKKITGSFDFLVNAMDMKPSAIAAYPQLLYFSLEKRIIPRGLVFKILMLEGLLQVGTSFINVLKVSEEDFSEKYLEKHMENIPYFLDVFRGKVSPPQELGFQYGCQQ